MKQNKMWGLVLSMCVGVAAAEQPEFFRLQAPMPLEISGFCTENGLQWQGVTGEDWVTIERSHTLADASAWQAYTRLKTPLRRLQWRLAHPSLPDGFRFVPAGTYIMGSPADEPGRQSNERQWEVTLNAFAMQVLPVTFAQWTAVRAWALDNDYPDLPTGQKGSHGNHRNTDHDPVTSITWYDAVKWLNARSEMEGKDPVYTVEGDVYRSGVHLPDWKQSADGYRLPTEAEWEYAARAGTLTASYAPIDDAGWYRGNSQVDGDTQTHPVGLKMPNAWGMHDMLGNVWEWCWDGFAVYPAGSQMNPVGASDGTLRVLRGGNYQLPEADCRAARRHAWRPDDTGPTFGFRPAISLPPAEHLRREPQFVESLDFGAVWQDGWSFREFLIENTGDTPLQVDGLSLPPGVSGNFSGVLAPGDQQKILLSFQQAGPNPLSGTVRVLSDANAGAEQAEVAGSSMGAPPPPAGFAVIPSGSYFRGSPADEPGRTHHETRHQVTLTQSFAIQRTPVTWAQWNEVRNWAIQEGYEIAVGQMGSHGDARNTDNDPVTNITWHDAVKWLNAKSEMEGLAPVYQIDLVRTYKQGISTPRIQTENNGYRLPTEAEWEYAARAGTQTAFYTGPITSVSGVDPVLSALGWYSGNSGQTLPVGQKQPNAWGLYDMLGNVWEWCQDWFDSYPDEAVLNPRGPNEGTKRVYRGGGWGSQPGNLRAAVRMGLDPSLHYTTIGFRPVIRTLPAP